MIVAIQNQGSIRWYESDPDYWILDQRKWAEAFAAAGYEANVTDFSDRFDIPVLDETTAPEFLERMAPFSVSEKQLCEHFREQAIAATDWFDVADCLPVLFVDFDARKVWSIDPESTSFVDYIPDGWTGEYDAFFDQIPEHSRYWVSETGDMLKRFLG